MKSIITQKNQLLKLHVSWEKWQTEVTCVSFAAFLHLFCFELGDKNTFFRNQKLIRWWTCCFCVGLAICNGERAGERTQERDFKTVNDRRNLKVVDFKELDNVQCCFNLWEGLKSDVALNPKCESLIMLNVLIRIFI